MIENGTADRRRRADGEIRGEFKNKLQGLMESMVIVRNKLNFNCFLPFQEEIKHTVQNSLSIFYKLQMGHLCL